VRVEPLFHCKGPRTIESSRLEACLVVSLIQTIMKYKVDRSLPIPVAEQIKGQMAYAIASGILNRGDPLPSVRELAATLQVAPVTISHVYRELSQQGLIVTKPGVGTFVADITCIAENDHLESSQKNLRQTVDNCLRQGLLLGHTVDDIQSMFLALAEQYRSESTVRRVVMVGNFEPATESYARDIESILHDLNVKVTPVLLRDLANPECIPKVFQSAKLVITVPTRLQEVNALLKSQPIRVTAIALRPNPDTRRKLSSIPPGRRIGLVTTYPEFLQTMINEVASYGMLKTPPPCTMIAQEDRVKSLLGKIDVLVYASGSEAVLDWLPPNVEAIELRHAPEPDSVNRLRPLLA
jgi:DNA-binding transcriptional regulator YhcF (GntR family)